MKVNIFLFVIFVGLVGCKPARQRELLFEPEMETVDSMSVGEVEDDTISYEPEVSMNPHANNDVVIPYREENGVKIVQAQLNGVGLSMIFDTGASTTLISLAEAQYLYSKGTLTDEDILNIGKSRIADGSIVEHLEINLREVVLGNAIVCHNVKAIVSKNLNAPLLLGNSVLNRAPSYTINNEQKQIIFHLQ